MMRARPDIAPRPLRREHQIVHGGAREILTRILTAAKEPLSILVLAARSELNKNTVAKILQAMRQEGMVESRKVSNYHLYQLVGRSWAEYEVPKKPAVRIEATRAGIDSDWDAVTDPYELGL